MMYYNQNGPIKEPAILHVTCGWQWNTQLNPAVSFPSGIIIVISQLSDLSSTHRGKYSHIIQIKLHVINARGLKIWCMIGLLNRHLYILEPRLYKTTYFRVDKKHNMLGWYESWSGNLPCVVHIDCKDCTEWPWPLQQIITQQNKNVKHYFLHTDLLHFSCKIPFSP